MSFPHTSEVSRHTPALHCPWARHFRNTGGGRNPRVAGGTLLEASPADSAGSRGPGPRHSPGRTARGPGWQASPAGSTGSGAGAQALTWMYSAWARKGSFLRTRPLRPSLFL